jgi:hypothetical protein
MDRRPKPADEPRAEPEIIPPGHADGQSLHERSGMWASVDTQGTHRVYFARVGPFGIILLMLVISILAVLIFIALLGAVLIWIPVLGVLFATAIVIGAVQRHLQRPR